MKKLVIVLAVLAFCLPAYAADPDAVLVYKVSGLLKGINIDQGEQGKIKFRAALVINVDFSGAGPAVLNDALILYGDDAAGVYSVVTLNNTIGAGPFVQTTSAKGKLAWGIEAFGPGNWRAVVTGRAKDYNIGSLVSDEEVVAKSLKGNVNANGVLAHYGEDVIGAGKVNLRLHRKLTRAANELDATFAETVALIDLELQP